MPTPSSPSLPFSVATIHQLTMLGGATAIDLHMVDPNRTHRITITW